MNLESCDGSPVKYTVEAENIRSAKIYGPLAENIRSSA